MLSAGQTFARYVIEASIGQGGMGEVYRAFDEKLRRKVALKVIHPDLVVPDAAARLVREARVAAGLAHPNTIAIYDLGEIDGTVFLVMELVSGAPMRAYVGDASVPVTRKLRWLVDMARGLDAAHKAGVVHRDVKPTNVMISDDDVVKVLDFGLAKPVEGASFHTDVGLVVGTPGYMAPELFTGATADARSDQYAFGVTAYELLSGVHPGHPMGPVPAGLDTLVPDVSLAAARVLGRTLSRAPSDRFATMNDVARALEALIGGALVSVRADASPATRRDGKAPEPLALAKTELQASGAAPSLGRGRILRALAILGVLVLVVAYGGARLLASGNTPASDAPAPDAMPSPLPDEGGGAPLATSFDVEAASQPPPSPVPGDAASDALLDAADVVPERPWRKVPLDDLPDPWVKPAPSSAIPSR